MKLSKLQKDRNVIFKQRVARHLSGHEDLAWAYESGSVIFVNERLKIVVVGWMQGYKYRTDDVPFKDIVAVHDRRCKTIQIGQWKGRSRILRKIVPQGT